MDSQMTERPTLHWVEVPSSDGGTRLEMRWLASPEAVRRPVARRLSSTRGRPDHTPKPPPARAGASCAPDHTPWGRKRTRVLF